MDEHCSEYKYQKLKKALAFIAVSPLKTNPQYKC